MYRLTGDKKWMEKGWTMFQALEKYTKTSIAYSGISDVMSAFPKKTDRMESFFLAETLKYYFLLFTDPKVLSLDYYVFSTEAHPFQRKFA
jgi:mannosyl-oligosaccharide alpha-1,2-mannosidase